MPYLIKFLSYNELKFSKPFIQLAITFGQIWFVFVNFLQKFVRDNYLHANLYWHQQVQSAILYVKGKVYEAMDNRAVATDCYKQALHYDVYSYQAFEALVQNQMLSAAEGNSLLIS